MTGKKILILGVTASGKGRLAFELAQKNNAEIISVDSMKVYRRMDIGTAKPSPQIRSQLPYHLIDVVEPSESFSVAMFLELTQNAIDDITGRGKNIVAVGGTALYIKAMLYGLFEGPGTDESIRDKLRSEADSKGLAALHERLRQIDPTAAQNIHPNDAKRIIRALEVHTITGKPISSFQKQFDSEPSNDWLVIGLRREKAEESKRINARVKKMLDAGLVEEVRNLLAEEKPLSQQARCAIGYAEIIEHLTGRITLDDAAELIKKNTRKLAKAQRTWFKTFAQTNWLDISPDEPAENIFSRAIQLQKYDYS
ncbi:MAG: tRNA (adenosine(37)-N6)-dimethylallyltransferase MiaA [Phycisphaerae bacterium]|jgi:tRNA dimethylallyltransferase